MRRLLASDLLPKRAGQPVKALVHIYFAELCEMDPGSALQDTWIAEYRAQWAAHRAAASAGTGDGGAWLEGDAARAIAYDAMIIPVVTGDIDAEPAAGCEPHHVLHRQDGGHTSLTNLKDYCWWHYHVVLHQMSWKLIVHPDGTSQVRSPDGKIIRSHGPPSRPG